MRKTERARELLTRELGGIIRKELDLPISTFVTITEVTLNDYLHAIVHVSVWPDSQRAETFREIKKNNKELRKLLGRRLPNLHPLPILEFELDLRVAEAARIEELSEKIKGQENITP